MATIQTKTACQNFGHALALAMPKICGDNWGTNQTHPLFFAPF
jgi:hypothetical protein